MLTPHQQKIPSKFRIGIVLLLMIGAALLSVQTAFAGAGPTDAQGASRLCVKGTVIGHDEKPLSDGWAISATDNTFQQTQVITSNSTGAFVFDPLNVDSYHFSIALKPGWEAITPAEFDVPVDYAADCLPVRFKLRRIVDVIVLKINDDHEPWPGWTICAEPGVNNFFATKICQSTDASGSTTFKLTPGNWTFIESPPAGVPIIPVIPTTDRQSLNVQAPGPYTIRFKNVSTLPTGCIDVYKYDSPPSDQKPFPLPGWKISVLRKDGSVAATGETDINGKVTFCKLPIGPYTVLEELRSGWKPASDSRYDVIVSASPSVVVNFYNRQDRGFCFEGSKIDTNGKVGLPGWKITATPVAVGGIQLDPVFTDGLGNYRICLPKDDYRVPGASYKICEETKPGWLAHTPTCYVATLPTYVDAPVKVPPFENQQVGHAESKGGSPGTSTPGAPSTKSGCRYDHTVKAGEYLSGIAVKYGVTVYNLKLANPSLFSHPDIIRIGSVLCIP